MSKPSTISIHVYCEECSTELVARVNNLGPIELEIQVEPCEHCMNE